MRREGDLLKVKARLPGSLRSVFPVILISKDIDLRAFGGSMARNLRAVLPPLLLKGEKTTFTPVRNLVIILRLVDLSLVRKHSESCTLLETSWR